MFQEIKRPEPEEEEDPPMMPDDSGNGHKDELNPSDLYSGNGHAGSDDSGTEQTEPTETPSNN